MQLKLQLPKLLFCILRLLPEYVFNIIFRSNLTVIKFTRTLLRADFTIHKMVIVGSYVQMQRGKWINYNSVLEID